MHNDVEKRYLFSNIVGICNTFTKRERYFGYILSKIKVAEVIWNYCIVKEFNLPSIKLFEETIENLRKSDPIMDELIDKFIDIKNEKFFQYKNFIAKNEIKTHDDGHHSIIVKSCAPEDYTKVFNMEKHEKIA